MNFIHNVTVKQYNMNLSEGVNFWNILYKVSKDSELIAFS